MLFKRIIPSILVSNKEVFKTVGFKKKTYIGDVINTVRLFNDLSVDELIVLDIEKSKRNEEPDFDLIESITSECFMPLTYGGGISSIEQASEIFRLGVEKVCLNTAAFKNLALVSQIAERYGNQSVVVSIDVKRNIFGTKKMYLHAEGRFSKKDLKKHLLEVESAGAGEIFLTDVDSEGKMQGFNEKFVDDVASLTNVPLVAHGGCGSFEDIQRAFEVGASAVSCGSYFIYQGPHKAVLINYLSNEEYNIINPIKEEKNEF